MYDFIPLCVAIHCPCTSLKTLFIPHGIVLSHLSKFSWLWMRGCFSGSWVLLFWFKCSPLCLHHAVLMTVALWWFQNQEISCDFLLRLPWLFWVPRAFLISGICWCVHEGLMPAVSASAGGLASHAWAFWAVSGRCLSTCLEVLVSTHFVLFQLLNCFY